MKNDDFQKRFQKISDWLWEIPKNFRSDMRVPARIYASEKILEEIFRDKSIPQLINGTTLPGIVKYAIAMSDCHQGYSVPIGFVGAIKIPEGVISPGACGFDINCGMRLLKSRHTEKEIKPYLENLASEIQKEIPAGLGMGRGAGLSIKEIDKILEGGVKYLVKQGLGKEEDAVNCEANGKLDWADSSMVSNYAKNRGRDQVGTLGSGNHFLEIQKVEKIFDKETARNFGLFKEQIVVMVHTGSRGLGHQVCTDYLKIMIPAMGKYKINVPDKEFACCPFNSSEGQRYFKAMACAANYAWANRQMITYYTRLAWQKVLGEQEELDLLYDVAHNIIKKENYIIDPVRDYHRLAKAQREQISNGVEGEKTEVIVHRKGATRAFPPGHLEIPERYRSVGQPVLIPGSMGTASYVLAGQKTGEEAFYSTSHGAGRTMSRHQAMRTVSGQTVINELKQKGIIVKCRSARGIAEEAPFVYKDVDDVAEVVHNAGLSKRVARLVPLAVIKGE